MRGVKLQGARATLLALLGWCAAGSEELAESAPQAGTCGAGGLSFTVHVGSRLLASGGGRLELRRGRALSCHEARVTARRGVPAPLANVAGHVVGAERTQPGVAADRRRTPAAEIAHLQDLG